MESYEALFPNIEAPIGVFDSGIGGLSVFMLLPNILPVEQLIYFADSANAPYGHKSKEQIFDLTLKAIDYLVQDQGCKAIVIACNTATAVAAKALRLRYPNIPIVGMEPAVKPAAKATKTGKIGVMATALTIGSEKYAQLIKSYGKEVEVFEDPCHGLVAMIESQTIESQDGVKLLNTIIQPMIQKGVDTIVLGCTHFPIIKNQIQRVAGSSVKLIDPSPAVVKQLLRVLQDKNLLL